LATSNRECPLDCIMMVERESSSMEALYDPAILEKQYSVCNEIMLKICDHCD